MENKFRKASIRNSSKWRIKGICVSRLSGLTIDEQVLLEKAQELIDIVNKNWDKNSAKLGFKVIRYKIKSEKNPFIDRDGLTLQDLNWCKKHYDNFEQNYTVEKYEII